MITENYNKNNAFYKMISGELSVKRLHEDEHCIVISDINPVAAVHLLIIPKAQRISFDDFVQNEPAQTVKAVFQNVQQMAKRYNLIESGYRIVMNHGADANQTVHHFHIHLLGGVVVGPFSALDKGRAE